MSMTEAAEATDVFLGPDEIVAALASPRSTLYLARRGDEPAPRIARPPVRKVVGILPPLSPESLGDPGFLASHQVRYPYVAGEMANGIASVRMVTALAQAGLLGIFGAAGLAPAAVEEAITQLRQRCRPDRGWGVNLIHHPHDVQAESRLAELFTAYEVPTISFSAYLQLTPAVVHCAVAGLQVLPDGTVARKSRIIAKVSRTEIARLFMSPAPQDILRSLVQAGQITPDQATWAATVPLADDITVEADSGGHTDNRPLLAALPAICALRDEVTATYGYDRPIRVGAAGGLGTPAAVAAAFAAGAAYVMTGSVNQSCAESGISPVARQMLATAGPADVGMCPAADMFELGVQVQVLTRATMFAARARRLYDLYRRHDSLGDLPGSVQEMLEKQVFRAPLGEIWQRTREYWQQVDPGQVSRAQDDPKHLMALVFRWYLGQSSQWAVRGEASRRVDYQLWCGPAMGAFNTWVAGSFLADTANRSVVQVALNLMEGAAVLTRAQQLRACGVPVPAAAFRYVPRPLNQTWGTQ